MFYHFLKISSAFILALLVYFVGVQQGCSPVLYGTSENMPCEEFPSQARCQVKRASYTCEEKPEQAHCSRPRPKPLTPEQDSPRRASQPKVPEPPPQHYLEYTYDVSLGEVDILFVIDNSSSMAEEHRSLARQFRSFLNDLRDVRYHVAVITTDISSSPNNPNRNEWFQDGRFIPIGKRKFLRNENLGGQPSQQVIEDFKTAIEREETKRCDLKNQPRESNDKYARLYQKTQDPVGCPSSDERGTYAINMALRNPSHRAFFRPEAHFMIVILSDEDIRSGEEFYNQPGFEAYQPEAYDEPETLVENIYNSFFERTKTFSVHSIIIPPGDSRCLAEQNRNRARGPGSGRGYYGKEYARLSKADRELKAYGNLLDGSVISICSRNYGYQLRRVAVSAQISRVPLPCAKPESIDLYVNGARVRSDNEIEGRTLLVKPRSDVSLSARLKVQVICPE